MGWPDTGQNVKSKHIHLQKLNIVNVEEYNYLTS